MPNPNLPPELLDHIVDLLYDDVDALKRCCLVSKSWIPGARKHLFADVKLRFPTRLQAWKNAFPNSSTSPACYAKSLFIGYPGEATVADAQDVGWIQTFSCVERLVVHVDNPKISLTPFHGFSPSIKSLHVDFTCSPCSIFNLIYSFPLLEDLSLALFYSLDHTADFNERPTTPQPPGSPVFTGSLKLFVRVPEGIKSMARWLMSLPSGLHFRELKLSLGCKEDVSPISALVERCSSTLESLEIDCRVYYEPLDPIDLSKATKLRNVVIMCKFDPQWITATLRTLPLKHGNFRQLSISSPDALQRLSSILPDPVTIKRIFGEEAYMGWLDLDRLLIQLHEIHSICLKVFSGDKRAVRSCVECLLPEVVTRRMVDLENLVS